MLAFFNYIIKVAYLTKHDAQLASIIGYEVFGYLKVTDSLYDKPWHQNRESLVRIRYLFVKSSLG